MSRYQLPQGTVDFHTDSPGVRNLGYGDPGITNGSTPPKPVPATPLAPPLPPPPPFYTMPAWPTQLRFSARKNVAHLPMSFSYKFNALPAGVEVNATIQFSWPTRLACRMGSGYLYTTGAGPIDFAVGTNARNWVDLAFWYNGVQAIDSNAGSGENLLGTGQRPGMFGGFGWTFLGNTFLQIRYTPILDDLYFTVTVSGVQIVESMDSWGGAGREFDLSPEMRDYQRELDEYQRAIDIMNGRRS